MISPKLMMCFALLMVMGQVISMGVEGEYWDGNEVEALSDSMTGYSVSELSGMGGILVGASGFLSHGLPNMLSWNYAFLQSHIAALNFVLVIIRTICVIVCSGGLIWGLVTQFQNYMIPAMIGGGILWGVGSLLS